MNEKIRKMSLQYTYNSLKSVIYGWFNHLTLQQTEYQVALFRQILYDNELAIFDYALLEIKIEMSGNVYNIADVVIDVLD